MTQGTGYIYTQRGDVVMTTRSGTTRNIRSNHRPFVAYKGVDTRITFYINDEGGKPVQLHDKTIAATVIKSHTNTTAFVKTLSVKNYESGICELSITPSDIADVNTGRHSLVLTYTDMNGSVFPVFIDKNGKSDFELKVMNSIIPDNNDSIVIETFNATGQGNELLSNQIIGNAQDSSSADNITYAIYPSSADGTLIMEASLVSNPLNESDWFQIDTTTLTVTDTITAVSVDGNFMWVRFRSDLTTGTIDKLLVLY